MSAVSCRASTCAALPALPKSVHRSNQKRLDPPGEFPIHLTFGAPSMSLIHGVSEFPHAAPSEPLFRAMIADHDPVEERGNQTVTASFEFCARLRRSVRLGSPRVTDRSGQACTSAAPTLYPAFSGADGTCIASVVLPMTRSSKRASVNRSSERR